MHSGTFVCNAFWEEKTRRHHNPLHALQLMWTFLEKAVLVVEREQANPRAPSAIAKVVWATVDISSYSKKCEAKQTCMRNMCVCEYGSLR